MKIGTNKILNNLEEKGLSSSEYIELSRKFYKNKKALDLKPLNIAFFSNYTLEFLEPFLNVNLAKKGFFLSADYNTYGMIEQNIFNPTSKIYTKKFDIFFIDLKFEDIFPDFEISQIGLNQDKADELLLNFEDYISNLLDNIRNNFKFFIFISNFSSHVNNMYSILEQNLEISKSDIIIRMNTLLIHTIKKYSMVYIYNYYSFTLNHGFSNIIDAKMSFFADIPFKVEYQIKLSESFTQTIFSALLTPKKCLICDLDNTLWGGILGEDGPNKIKLGESFPGNIYKDFQRSILSIRNLGIFIAIASKNEEKDVIEFMNSNKDCLIKPKHISAFKANWNDKASNIIEIAKELNIGLDSIVFFDDSKHEREWVRNQLPEVNVLEVPNNPLLYKKTLFESAHFNKLTLSEEDKVRPVLYEIEKKRKLSKNKSTNLEEYIISLKMKITISEINDQSIHRTSQLLNKVNQFNLTTKRYNENNLLKLKEEGYIIYTIRVEDKFGDTGLTGVIIIQPLPNKIWKIDSFLLSCRVLGRNIEKIILNFISKKLIKINGQTILGEYIPSKKNMLVKDLYKSLDFQKSSNNTWLWKINKGLIYDNNICEIIETDD